MQHLKSYHRLHETVTILSGYITKCIEILVNIEMCNISTTQHKKGSTTQHNRGSRIVLKREQQQQSTWCTGLGW